MVCKAMVEPLPPSATQPGPWTGSGLGPSLGRPVGTSLLAAGAATAIEYTSGSISVGKPPDWSSGAFDETADVASCPGRTAPPLR